MQNKNNFNQIFPKIVVSIFLFILGIWVGRYIDLPFLQTNPPKYQVLNKIYTKDNVDFSTFWQVWDKLNTTYLNKKDLNGQKLMQGAISGLVNAAGDPYTSYFDPSANKSFTDQISGSFEGVGMELGVKDNKLVVIAPLEDSPAKKAGILAGDQILQIDSKDATKMTLGEAVALIRGKSGTSIKLQILHEGNSKATSVTLTRATITIKTVKSSIQGDTAVITVSEFGDNTRDEWDSVVNELVSKGIKKIVLDLRNDPGGRFDSAIHIAGDFLNKNDVVVEQEDANGNRQEFRSDTDPRLTNTQVVILINKGSASASEIVTGALMDHDKATLVGETSFGKGTVQAVTDLKDGSGLHITIAKWLTPKGTWVHGKGIKPDYEVKMTQDDVNAGKDPQKDKALDLLK